MAATTRGRESGLGRSARRAARGMGTNVWPGLGRARPCMRDWDVVVGTGLPLVSGPSPRSSLASRRMVHGALALENWTLHFGTLPRGHAKPIPQLTVDKWCRD